MSDKKQVERTLVAYVVIAILSLLVALRGAYQGDWLSFATWILLSLVYSSATRKLVRELKQNEQN